MKLSTRILVIWVALLSSSLLMGAQPYESPSAGPSASINYEPAGLKHGHSGSGVAKGPTIFIAGDVVMTYTLTMPGDAELIGTPAAGKRRGPGVSIRFETACVGDGCDNGCPTPDCSWIQTRVGVNPTQTSGSCTCYCGETQCSGTKTTIDYTSCQNGLACGKDSAQRYCCTHVEVCVCPNCGTCGSSTWTYTQGCDADLSYFPQTLCAPCA